MFFCPYPYAPTVNTCFLISYSFQTQRHFLFTNFWAIPPPNRKASFTSPHLCATGLSCLLSKVHIYTPCRSWEMCLVHKLVLVGGLAHHVVCMAFHHALSLHHPWRRHNHLQSEKRIDQHNPYKRVTLTEHLYSNTLKITAILHKAWNWSLNPLPSWHMFQILKWKLAAENGMEGTIHRRNRTHVQLWQVVHGGSCTGSYWGLRHRHILHRHGIELIHPCRTNRGMTIMFQAYLDSLDRISVPLFKKQNKNKNCQAECNL